MDSGELDFDRVLVAPDGSESAYRACGLATALAEAFGSEITNLQVIPALSIFTAPLAYEYTA